MNSVYSKKSDLYQVGLILFQLINGKIPDDTDFYAKMTNKPYNEHNIDNLALAQLTKLVSKNKLTEVINVEPIYCSRLRRLVDNALKLRYTSAVTFYSDVCKVKNQIPDWRKEDNYTYTCDNWKKCNFKTKIELEGYRVFKIGLLRSRELGLMKSSLDLNGFFQNL